MPLQKQTIDIPLAGGIETKADPKVVPPGSVLVLENGELDETGAVSKRNGYTALSNTRIDSGSIGNVVALATHDDNLVAIDDDGGLFVRSSEADHWIRKGTCWATDIRTRHVGATPESDSVSFADCVVANGYALYVSIASGEASAVIVEADTGVEVVPQTRLTASANGTIRAVASGDYLYVLYGVAAELRMRSYNTASPSSALTSATVLASNHFSSGRSMDADAFDAANNTGVVAYQSTTPDIRVIEFDASGVVTGPTTVAVTPSLLLGIGIVVTAALDVYVAYVATGTGDFMCFALDSSLSSKFASVTMQAAESPDFCGGVEESTNVVRWFYDGSSTGAISGNVYTCLKTATIDSAGSTSGGSVVSLGSNAASRPFVRDGVTFILALHDNFSDQRQCLMLDIAGKPHARILPFEAMNISYTPQPCKVSVDGSGFFHTAVLASYSQNTTISSSATVIRQRPVAVRIGFARAPRFAKLGSNLHITGGQLYEFDGSTVYEHGFHVFPTLIGEATSTAGGTLPDGSYQWTAVYTWTDNGGQIHHSAPAAPRTVVFSGGTNTNRFTSMRVMNLRVTNRSGVRIVYYVTDTNGSVFYEHAFDVSSTAADESDAAYSAPVNTANRQLYTTGGILENDPPSAMQSIVEKGGRLYGVTHDGRLVYSKQRVVGEAVAFVPELLEARLVADNGNSYEIAEMDGRVVVFGENTMQFFAGVGFNETGTFSDLTEAQRIVCDTGATAGCPVVSTPIGIVYKATSGIRLLNRSLGIDDQFGMPVAAYNDLTLVSAVLVPSKNQLRLGHLDGSALVYDFQASQRAGAHQWAAFTSHTQLAAVNWGGRYTLWQTAESEVWVQSTGFEDPVLAANITMTVETPWIKLSGLQGFQRLYYVSLLGEYRSSHTCTLTPYFDYSQSAGTAVSLATTTLASGDPLQFRHHLGRKCQAVKFRLVDSSQAGTKESYMLTGLSLEMGGKGGVFRQSSAKTV